MTIWLALLKALLGLAEGLTGYLRDRQLLDAGRAQEAATGLRSAMEAIRRAEDAGRAARVDALDPERMQRDRFNRD